MNVQDDQANMNVGEIEVHLDWSRKARAFPPGQSLWEPEITRIMSLIKGQSDILEKNGQINSETPNLSIAIFGTYGSGKSSLLRTLASRVNDNQIHKDVPIRSLPVIEPNILNKQDHFLYSFLATALEEHYRFRTEGFEDESESQVLSPVQKAFLSLSEDLKVIDDRIDLKELDSHEISMSRLERHTSGLSLQKKLASFLDKLVSNLAGPSKNSLLLMPVDDADMSMEELISTLDTLRRYLQHPRLVPVFTFTGRLAEELLRVNYGQNLHIGAHESADDKLQELASSIDITESLALQYLGKLFPVRNRIRLGYAAARAQASQYLATGDQSRNVMSTLQLASELLFGFSNSPIESSIRSSLRAATLRRQLQIIDALHAANINFFYPNEGHANLPISEMKDEDFDLDSILGRRISSWVNIYDSITWALLNVHRDILREFQLNLDDLYSWTPMSLRQVILSSILSKDLKVRQRIVHLWQFNSEDRRSQMLSLMAVNIFRPRMLVEETTGDDPRQIEIRRELKKDLLDKDYKQHVVRSLSTSFSTREGALWFLNLWYGFYLPQALFSEEKERVGEAQSVGWDFVAGPTIAVKKLIQDNKVMATGSVRVDHRPFENVLDDVRDSEHLVHQLKDVLLLNIWCSLGFDGNRPWAALSLWRGLGLLGQILRVDIEMRASYLVDKPYEHPEKRKERIKKVIQNHVKNVMSNEEGHIFQHWHFEGSFKTVIEILTDDIIQWLDGFDPEFQRIYPMWPAEYREDEGKIRKMTFDKKKGFVSSDILNHTQKLKTELPEIYEEMAKDKQFANKAITATQFIENLDQFLKEAMTSFEVIQNLEHIIDYLELPLKETDHEIYMAERDIESCNKEIQNSNNPQEKKDLTRKRNQKIKILNKKKDKRENHFNRYDMFASLLRLCMKRRGLGDIGRLSFETSNIGKGDEPNNKKKIIDFSKEQLNWESCCIRRLHGHELMSRFLTDLDGIQVPINSNDSDEQKTSANDSDEQKTSANDSDEQKTSAYEIMKHWCSALINYWNCGRKWKFNEQKDELEWTKRKPKIVTLLASCPFVRPFAEMNLLKDMDYTEMPNFGQLEFSTETFQKINVDTSIKNDDKSVKN